MLTAPQIEEEKKEEVDLELESFLMIRSFENVREFVKKAGLLFEMLDELSKLNKTFKSQVKKMRAESLKEKASPLIQQEVDN